MASSKALKIADDGYSTVLKIIDFILINLTMSAVVDFLGESETAVDITAAFIFSTVFLLIGEYCSLYSHRTLRRVRSSIKRVVITLLISIVVMKVIRIAFHNVEGVEISHLTPYVFDIWYLLLLVIVLFTHLVPIFAVRAYRRANHIKKRIAIIGMTSGGLAAERSLLQEYNSGSIDIKYYDDRGENRFGYLTRTPYAGKVDVLLELARKGEVDEVYIALPMVAKDRIRHYLQQLSDSTVDTFLIPDLYTYNLNVSSVKSINGVQIFSVFGSPFDGVGAAIKRIEDVIIGSIITLMISPVLLAVAVGVKLSSPGPVLFKQDRYGLGGKKIKVWKFRSMKVMENSDVVTQATKNDPRVTKFGAFIRRTSLDELPQFINVLQGQMSIVGPRPHAVAHNEQYRKIVDNYMIRHKIKPGITGWAQINGYRGETETVDKMEKRIQYDIQYLHEWTLWLDLKIIFLTVFKGFVSETAY